jgi:predicted outer membrane protein
VRPPVPRFVRWTVVLAMIVALTVAVFQYWGMSQYGVATAHNETAQGDEWTQTPWGPLGPADRNLLVKIRQAGLCEGATGLQAQQQAGSGQVRTIGKHVSAEYADLDNQVRSVAGKLGVVLPDQPTEQQKDWMRELSGLSGSTFDRAFAQRMRFAHGEVLPIITGVRAGTRNDLIRSFAATAAAFVNRHMEYLERTGLVNYATLPEPPRPAAALPAAAGPPPALRPPAAPMSPAAGLPPARVPPVGQEQQVNQVVNATPVNGANVVVAAVVYIGALLGIVGLLTLLGNAGLRARRTSARSARPRHAAQRW